MEVDAFKLLNYLKESNGLHNKISIAPLIDELVPNPLDFYNYRLVMKPLYLLLHKLQDTDSFISYDQPPSKW
jgi:hypothetical protein